ncbi:electron transfer flavoprotein subunit alpha/FixB family protein [Phytoactinopolyspora limicola]|uniref:electron transfer flavoprotein subunit alpha/FixB family protein n=1 Tax=Phytoactinopolyspora limicola TaxID=2715536 RepID=UPI001407AE43|nr:electron transfer flavoprotein subunit alpha/FixB family protein [Phytoactinopolyspora limicola]
MVLAFVDLDAGSLTPSATETLTLARELASTRGEPLRAMTFDDSGRHDDAPTAAELTTYGVVRWFRVAHPLLDAYSPELWGAASAQLVRTLAPSAVVASAGDRTTEVMAQTAARLDLPLAANCTTITATASGDEWRLTRVRNGGMLLEDAELVASTALFTVAAGAIEPAPASVVGDLTTETFSPVLDDTLPHARVIERTTRGDGVTLASARVVVSGGRGVGGADGFAPLEELAELVGGAVGCSRVATNNGWRPHRDQVGQTGTKVNPDLYIACGISGATQHWVGCMGAKHILAINTDPDAPLVSRATYAVIGDVGEVVPAVVAEIRRRTPSPLPLPAPGVGADGHDGDRPDL